MEDEANKQKEKKRSLATSHEHKNIKMALIASAITAGWMMLLNSTDAFSLAIAISMEVDAEKQWPDLKQTQTHFSASNWKR